MGNAELDRWEIPLALKIKLRPYLNLTGDDAGKQLAEAAG